MAQPAGGPGGSPLAGARVLLGVTGGIAAYKAAELARELQRAGAEVQPLLTESGERMVSRATFAALTGRRVPASVWDDPAAVEHVALARWGQVLVVAPATAHTLARLAAGLADDLLDQRRPGLRGPVVVAPAMHTEMWEHPATRANLAPWRARGPGRAPASGPLTSGDVGPGRLAELDDLVAGVAAASRPEDEPGRDPAAGQPGRDPGAARPGPLPRQPLLGPDGRGDRGRGPGRGAEVTAVAAATTVDPPAGARLVRVETAQQLYDAVLAEADAQDVLIMAAAVADFRPKRVAEGKLKKDQGVPEVVLEPTPDTLAELGRRRRPGQVLVGFAAETGDHLAGARRKLEAKRLDLVVLNHVEGARSAFGADDADAYLVDADHVEELPRSSKAAIAARLLDRVEASAAARS